MYEFCRLTDTADLYNLEFLSDSCIEKRTVNLSIVFSIAASEMTLEEIKNISEPAVF